MVTLLKGRTARPREGVVKFPGVGNAHPHNGGRRNAPPRPMTRADICNVEPVSQDELQAMLEGIGYGAAADDRVTLTLEGLTCRV